MRSRKIEFENSSFATGCDLSMKKDSKYYDCKATRIAFFEWEKTQ